MSLNQINNLRDTIPRATVLPVDRSLATISEITRHNFIALDLLKTYQLVTIPGSSQDSLLNSLLLNLDLTSEATKTPSEATKTPSEATKTPSEATKTPSESEIINAWTKLTGINLVIWSSNNQAPQIQLYSAKDPVEIDRPTLMIFRNKYGQYHPIQSIKSLRPASQASLSSNSVLYYLGPDNPQKQTSYLLLKLLNQIHVK